jgi:hypothetical protein
MATTRNDRPTGMLTDALSRRTALRGLGGAGLAAALSLVAAGRAAAFVEGASGGAAQGADPAAVIAAYVAAANAHDLDAILALYADDAVHIALPTPDGSAGVCLGKDQFRLWYEQSIKDGDQIEVVDGTLKVDGNSATFAVRISSEPWKKLGLEALDATAECVVVDGTIRTHVVMLMPDSVRRLLIARGTIPAAPTGGEHAHGGGASGK